MKRRTRTQPSNPFYQNEPSVATGLMADKPPVQNSSLGNKTPKSVPKKPGKMSGIAGFAGAKRPKKTGFKKPSVGAPAKPKTNVPTPKSKVYSSKPKSKPFRGVKPLGRI